MLGKAQWKSGSFHTAVNEHRNKEQERFKPIKTGLKALHRLYVIQYFTEKTVNPNNYVTVISGDKMFQPLKRDSWINDPVLRLVDGWENKQLRRVS